MWVIERVRKSGLYVISDVRSLNLIHKFVLKAVLCRRNLGNLIFTDYNTRNNFFTIMPFVSGRDRLGNTRTTNIEWGLKIDFMSFDLDNTGIN